MSSSILNKLVNAIDKKAAVAKRPQRLNVAKQAQMLHNSVMAYLANENPKVLPERRVTKRAALTVVRRSLDRTRGLSFSIREYQALRDLGLFVSLSQSSSIKSAAFADNTDLLPISHPLCSRAHAMTASALRQARGHWMSTDPRLEDDLRPVVASAFGAPMGTPEQVHALAQLQSAIGRFVPSDTLVAEPLALIAGLNDGNSSAARRARAMLQRRDSEGQFAEMGGGRRWLMKGLDGIVSWMTGQTVAADPDTETFDVQTPDGKVYRVPANATSGVKAVLKTDVEKGEARYSAKDLVLSEADVKEIDAPAGYEISPNSDNPNTDIYRSTDGEYVVAKSLKPDQKLKSVIANITAHNKKQEDLAPDKKELRELVGAGEDGKWDTSKPFYTAYRMDEGDSGKPELVPIGVSQDWAETQKIIKTDEPRLDKKTEERKVKATLKESTWTAWQEKVKKFNEANKANHAEHVAERMALLKKQAADGVDNQGNQLEPGWSAVAPDDTSVRPPKEVSSIPGMYKDTPGLSKELNPLDPDQGELFDADPTPDKYDVANTEFIKNNSLVLKDADGNEVARLEQNADGALKASWVLGEGAAMDTKQFKDRPEFIEALKERAALKRERLAKAAEEAGAAPEVLDIIRNPNSTRDEIAGALEKDKAVDSARAKAADLWSKDSWNSSDKAAVNLAERLVPINAWSASEIDDMVDGGGGSGAVAKLEPTDVLDDAPVESQQKPKANLEENKPFEYAAPQGAYKMDLDGFSPEGAIDGQESKDYTDDPVEISNRYPEAELRESLAKALINKQSAYDAVVDEDSDEIEDFDPDEIVDEEAPKKTGPKPKSQKKQAADSGVKTMEKETAAATGFGMLEFNSGSELVPAESLYKALEEQGVDAELYVAQLYDAKLGENKNVKALLDSRKGNEMLNPQSPDVDLADVFPTQEDLDEMDSIDIPEEGSSELTVPETDEAQAKSFEMATALVDYKKEYEKSIKDGNVDEATEAVYNSFIGADPAGTDKATLIDKHFDQDKFGQPDDPFRAVWGAFMAEGPNVAQAEVTEPMVQYAVDTLGMDEAEAGEFSENVIDTYGNPGELEEALARIDGEPELLNSSDAELATAQALLKMAAVNAGANKDSLYKRFDPTDVNIAEALEDVGQVISLPVETWTKDPSLSNMSVEEGDFVLQIKEGQGTSSAVSETRELLWGQYVVDSVVDSKTADGVEYKLTTLRKLEQAEHISLNENGNYVPYLMPNENIDLPDGYNLPDTDQYQIEYNGTDGNEVAAGFPDGFTDSPLYIAENWDTETLLESLRIAVEPDLDQESAGYAILEYPLDGGTDLLVSGQAIRDALQVQGVNTNLFFRDLAGTGDPTVPPSEADVARQNKSALSKAKNPTEAIGTSVGNSFDITEWKKVGNQLGSNAGGTYEAPDGSTYYVKKPISPLHAGNEVLASALYRRAGVDGADTFFGVDEADNLVTVSPLLPDAKPDMAKKLDEPSYKKALQEGFAIDAWLANWDVAGLDMDNVVSVDGKPNRVDTGGALLMRAMGKPKGELFGDKADEWETLRNPGMNPQSAKIFGDMTDADLKTSASKLLDVTKADIDSIVGAAFPDDPALQKTIADKLELRRQDILERAGLTAEDPTVTANNLKNVQAHTQTIMDITGLDEENAKKVRDVIDDEYGLDWSEATASETGEAIKEALNSDAYDGPLPEGFKSTNKNKKTETKAPTEPPVETAEEEEEDELTPGDAYVIADDFADEISSAVDLYLGQDDIVGGDIDLQNKLTALKEKAKALTPIDNPDDIAELQKSAQEIADELEKNYGKGGEFKSIADNLLIAGDVAKKDKIDVVQSPITPGELDSSKYADNAGEVQWFDDTDSPKLSEDGNFVEVTLNDIGGDMPNFGDDEGPADLAELGVPYIVKEGEAQDGTYDIEVRVPIDKMDEFTEKWNELKNADLGPYQTAPTGYYEKPENFFGDVYRDANGGTKKEAPAEPVAAPVKSATPTVTTPGESLSADGKTPIAAGMKVKSTKTGETGVVSKLDVYKKKGVVFPDYAWVKFDGKKDKQLKTTKTLQIVDDGGFPEGGPEGGEPDAPAPIEPAPSSAPASPLTPSAPPEKTAVDYSAPPVPPVGPVETYKLAVLNSVTAWTPGSSFQNKTLEYTPKELTDLLGKPYKYGSGEKITQEWSMRFDSADGQPIFATIYDWKEGVLELDDNKKYTWHIGGTHPFAAELVKDTLEKKKSSQKTDEPGSVIPTMNDNPVVGIDKKEFVNTDNYEIANIKVKNLKPGDVLPYGYDYAHVTSHAPKTVNGKKTNKYRMLLHHTNGKVMYVDYSAETLIMNVSRPIAGGKLPSPPTVANPPLPPSSKTPDSPVKSYSPEEWLDATKKVKNNNEYDFGPFENQPTSTKSGASAVRDWVIAFNSLDEAKSGDAEIDLVASSFGGNFIVSVKTKGASKAILIMSNGTIAPAPQETKYYEESGNFEKIQPGSAKADWLKVNFKEDPLAPVQDELAPPPGANQKFKKDRFNNWLYAGVTVTDADGNEGVVYGFPGAKGYENYVQVKFLDGSKKVRSVDKVTGGRLYDQEKLTEAGPGVNVPELEDPELTSIDWSQSELTANGVRSLVDAVTYVQSSPTAGARGSSAAIDAGDIEDLDVHMMSVTDNGKTYTRASFKLTSWAGDALVDRLLKTVKNTDDYDLNIQNGIRLPKIRKDAAGNMVIQKNTANSSTEWEYSTNYTEPTTYIIQDKVTGAVIRIYRANNTAKPVSSLSAELSGLAFHNRVEVLVPPQQDANSTANAIGRGLRLAGVRAPRAATTSDVRVLTENRLLSIFGKETDPAKNVVGTARTQKLKAIEKMLGLPFGQMWESLDVPSYDLNDRLSYRTSPAIAEYITKKTETGAITHSFPIKSGGGPDEIAAALFALLTGEDGLKSTSVRWTEGIGGHGESSEADIKTGGADYIFTKPKATMKPYSVSSDSHAYFHFDPMKLYSRLDFWANFKDQFGKRMKETDPISQIKPAKPNMPSGTFELMFKNGVSWADLSMISISPKVRERLVKMLLDNGLDPKKFGGAQSWDDLIPIK